MQQLSSLDTEHPMDNCPSRGLLCIILEKSGGYGAARIISYPPFEVLRCCTVVLLSARVSAGIDDRHYNLFFMLAGLLMNFARVAPLVGLLFTILNHRGIFKVRYEHTGPPSFSSVSDGTRVLTPSCL